MARTVQVRSPNLLLAALPPEELTRLEFESTSYPEGHVLIESFKPIREVFFPFSGVVSFLMPVAPGQQIEAGMVGSEGLTGVCLALGSDRAPARAIVQTQVYGLKMPARTFRAEVLRNGPFAEVVRRYAHAYIVMLAQGLVCMRAHRVEQRCARWMLMLHDRLNEDTFALTHRALACMLAVRRATVTEVASSLQDRGFVDYRRGTMRILDRRGLEEHTCICYSVVREELKRLRIMSFAPANRTDSSEMRRIDLLR